MDNGFVFLYPERERQVEAVVMKYSSRYVLDGNNIKIIKS